MGGRVGMIILGTSQRALQGVNLESLQASFTPNGRASKWQVAGLKEIRQIFMYSLHHQPRIPLHVPDTSFTAFWFWKSWNSSLWMSRGYRYGRQGWSGVERTDAEKQSLCICQRGCQNWKRLVSGEDKVACVSYLTNEMRQTLWAWSADRGPCPEPQRCQPATGPIQANL